MKNEKQELSLHGEEKLVRVIKSCRTLDQCNVAENMIKSGHKNDLINSIQLDSFLHILKTQKWFIERKLFPGDKVIAISNQNEPVMVCISIDYDYGRKSSPGITYVKDVKDGKDYYCFSILIHYESEDQVAKINAIPQPDRWNNFCLPTNKISKR